MTQQLQLPLAAALLSALSGSLWAESAAYLELDPVVVTATRTAQPLSQAASSISVVKAKDIEETVPQTFTDTLRVMSVKYGGLLNNAAGTRSYTAIAVGRVMTCVLDGLRQGRHHSRRQSIYRHLYRSGTA